MTPADFADLRQRICKVHAELGAALLELEAVESHLGNGLTALAHDNADLAVGNFECAAAHLAEIITTTDRLTTQLAPQGVQP